MKKKLCCFSLFLLLSIFNNCLFAQDTLFKKNKEQVICKVEEIGINEIKYRDFNNLNGPVFVVRKTEVWKIKYENGTETILFADPYSVNQEEAIHNKSNAIKFEFFSPMRHNLGFAYEHSIKVGTSIETKIGIIGPGISTPSYEKPSGVYIKIGPKFLTGSSIVTDGMRYAHQLKGFYIKPELIFNTFTLSREVLNYQSYPYVTSTEKLKYTNYAVNIVFGKQYILGNIMTLDLYGGIGYGGQKSDGPIHSSPYESDYFEPTCYSHVYLGPGSPMVLSGGISLGMLF